MENKFIWNVPVILLPYIDSEKQRTIADTRDAAHFLTFEWPWFRGESHDAALRACGLVLGGFILPDASRTSLVRAVEEMTIEAFRPILSSIEAQI